MNKRIDLTKLGGFPATQYTLNWMQDSYRDALSAIASMVGNNAIVTGLEITGTQATNGWISYNGELLPFQGGTVLPTFVIEEIKESRVFNDNESKDVYFTKRARFGSPGIAFNTLFRFGTVAGLWQKGDTKDIYVDAEYIAANFDGTGLGRLERIGWAICNGQNGTPNVGGKVIVGYDPTDLDFNVVGDTGGSKTRTIVKDNLPAIKLDVRINTGDTSKTQDGSGKIVCGGDGNEPVPGPTLKTDNIGSSLPFSIMQPYFVMLKIIKL